MRDGPSPTRLGSYWTKDLLVEAVKYKFSENELESISYDFIWSPLGQELNSNSDCATNNDDNGSLMLSSCKGR